MRLYAYCAASMRESVLAATGVEPDTCPAPDGRPFNPARMMGHDVVVLKFHAATPGDNVWLGDEGTPALSVAHFARLRLEGTVIVAQTCYMPASPFLAAMLGTGAGVIGGHGLNQGGISQMVGSDWLVHYLIDGLKMGMDTAWALRYAKARTVLRGPTGPNLDAMGFELYGGER